MRVLLLAALLGGILVTSCKKSDVTPILSYPSNRLTANVGSQTFTSNELTASLTASSVTVSAAVNAGTSKASNISLHVGNYVTLASYSIDSTTTAIYSDVSGTYTATNGTIAIATYNSDRVEGTFSFDAVLGSNHKSISAGSFVFYRQ